MTLNDAWFVKMLEVSNLVKRFEGGADHCPYLFVQFYNGNFDHGTIEYSSIPVVGAQDFDTLDELLSIIRKLLEQQAAANLPG